MSATMDSGLSERRSLATKRRLDSMLEIVAGYIILLVVNLVWFPENLGWLDVVLHPYFLVTMLIAARYGTLDGLTTGLLGAVIFTWFQFEATPQRFVDATFLLDAELMRTPYLLVLLGTILGEVRQVAQDEIDELWGRHKQMRGDMGNLSGEARVVRQTNQDLQERIASSVQTTGAFYDAAAEVQTLREDEALPAILEMVERFVGATECAIYVRGPAGWELRVTRGWETSQAHPRTVTGDNALLRRVLDGEVVTMKDVPLDMDGTDIVMAAPLYHGDGVDHQVYAAITVQQIPLSAVNLATVRNLEGISRWASRVLVSAEMFERVRERDPSDAITGAYRYSYMLGRLNEECGRFRRYKTPSTLLLMRVVHFDRVPRVKRAAFLRRLGRLVSRNIREVDLVSRWRTGDTFALLLPSTGTKGATLLAQRLQQKFDGEIAPDVPQSAALALGFGVATTGPDGEGKEDLSRAAENFAIG
ncbi:MAG: diguanylate cyclase (GGDEF)-like protein [Myxococcota bacterium]|jgi:diguanylate cyclase (GGDEF)-like protein